MASAQHKTRTDTQVNQEADMAYDAQSFAGNMAAAAQLWQQVMTNLSAGFMENPQINIGHADPMNIGTTFLQLAKNLASHPEQLYESQMGLMSDHLHLWRDITQQMLGKAPEKSDETRDRRFKDDGWNNSIYFDYLKRSYLLNSQWVQNTTNQVEGLDEHTARKVSFFTKQLLDAASPSNFLFTNPEVMRTTIESNGENIVKGLNNLLEDIAKGNGKLRISMTDDEAFELGKNIATTPGKVVYENDLMQLIQYEPQTAKVHEVPLLLIPAWINKYYVLDLRAENSFVRWAVEQGYTVFIISWVNPDEELARKQFDDYLSEGPLTALDVIEAITGSAKTNLVGYCLGGTLTTITMAYLHAHKEQHRIGSATTLTTLVDFTEAGELSVFIDEEQLDSLEGRMSDKGYLEGNDMATTFNMLRANDLIWSFVVNNYLLGKEPFAFDLLYWNSDCTRMPARMHSFYLRNMYQKNLLAKSGGIELLDTPINITKIKTPTYILSTQDDHIAPWTSTYAATQIYDGKVRFVLSQSGHVAGVINPPSKQKYGYWVQGSLPPKAQDWFAGADRHEGSWWPDWHSWQQHYAGAKVKARKPGNARYKPIEDAPGAYARIRV